APSYVATMHMQMAFLAEGAKVEMRVEQTYEFDPDPPFALRRGTFAEAGGGTQKAQLVRTPKGFEATRSIDGVTTKKLIGPLDYSLTEELLPRVWLRRGAKPGDRLASQTFDFEKLKLDPENRKLLSTKTSLSGGVPVTYHEVEMTSPKLGVAVLERYDGKGHLLSGKLGSVIELRAEDEQRAEDLDKNAD